MTISEYKKFFKAELSELYNDSETAFLSSVFVEKITGFNSFYQRKFSDQELLTDDEQKLSEVLNELKTGKSNTFLEKIFPKKVPISCWFLYFKLCIKCCAIPFFLKYNNEAPNSKGTMP